MRSLAEAHSAKNKEGAAFAQHAFEHLQEHCPYAACFCDVDYELKGGLLRLEGSVGSFYLKSVLQTFLADIEGVEQIDNQVDVVSSRGLSSVRPK